MESNFFFFNALKSQYLSKFSILMLTTFITTFGRMWSTHRLDSPDLEPFLIFIKILVFQEREKKKIRYFLVIFAKFTIFIKTLRKC